MISAEHVFLFLQKWDIGILDQANMDIAIAAREFRTANGANKLRQ